MVNRELKLSFLNQYGDMASASQEKTGVPSLVTLSQAALESGWGKHAPGNNFFGVKADKSWKGAKQYLQTKEYSKSATASFVNKSDPDDGKTLKVEKDPKGGYMYTVLAAFRKYNSPEESFTDHGMFLKNNPRYNNAFLQTHEHDFIKEIVKAGYATAPNYADQLIALFDYFYLLKMEQTKKF